MGLTRPRAYQIYDLDYKQAVRAVITTDVNLTGGAPSQVDGVNLNLNDRVLVTGNDPASENGLYYVTTVGTGSNGTWQRSVDGNETGEIEAGLIVMVTEGLVYADTQWKLTTNDPIVVGTTPLTFILNVGSIVGGLNTQVQFNDGGVMGGSAGLTYNKTANALTVVGNVAGGNLTTANQVVATGNITGGNLITVGLVSATGNITGGNLLGILYTNNIVNSGANATGNIGSSTGYFNTAFVKATSAQYADLAEMYVSDGYYPPGHVVVFGGEKEITLSTQSHDTAVAGIISTNPSYLMNSTQDGEFVLAVALTGRVPCMVQGPVNKGDVLVSGSRPGTAQRIGVNWQPGCTVGKAMETIESTEVKVIEVAVGRL